MKRFIRRYMGFTRCAMEERVAYRKGFWMGSTLHLVEILVSVFLWKVLFAEQSVIQGYNWNQMVLYVLIVALLNATLGFNTEMKLSESILDGSIASDLTKPIDFQVMSFFRALGHSLVEGGTTAVLIVLLAGVMTDLSSCLVLTHIVLFIPSLILAFMLKFCLAYFGGLMCFFTSNGYGVVYLRQVITDVFSGALLPLAFFRYGFSAFLRCCLFRRQFTFQLRFFWEEYREWRQYGFWRFRFFGWCLCGLCRDSFSVLP